MDGVDLSFDKDAVEVIADKALERNTGARSLRSIIEETMTDIMFDVPSEPDVKKCIIKKECITGDSAPEIVREKVS